MISFLLAAQIATAAPVWPADLTQGWSAIGIKRSVPGQPPRSAKLERGPDGVWRAVAPWRGDADVDAIGRLALALEAPQLLTVTAQSGTVAFEIELRQGTRVRKIVTMSAALNQPISLSVDGKPFVASPVELSIRIPDPSDFAPPGLWVAAKNDAISIEVKGPARYKLVGRGEDWKAADGRIPNHDLDDVVGVVVGRQSVGHPLPADLKALGLLPPLATARVCTEKSCRDFSFGTSQGHYYAKAPDSDPIEIRDNDWKLLVNGPFEAADGGTAP